MYPPGAARPIAWSPPVRAPSVHAPQCVPLARPGTRSVARTPGRFPSRGPPARSLTGAPPWRSPVTRARLGRSRPSGPAAPPVAPTWRCAGHAVSSTTTLAPAGATSPWRRCGGGTSAYSGASADRHATATRSTCGRPAPLMTLTRAHFPACSVRGQWHRLACAAANQPSNGQLTLFLLRNGEKAVLSSVPAPPLTGEAR